MLCYLNGWTLGKLWYPAGMILYRQSTIFTVNKTRAQCATTLMIENIMSDSSEARPQMKTAPDNFGSCHIKTSPTATVKSVRSLVLMLPTNYWFSSLNNCQWRRFTILMSTCTNKTNNTVYLLYHLFIMPKWIITNAFYYILTTINYINLQQSLWCCISP